MLELLIDVELLLTTTELEDLLLELTTLELGTLELITLELLTLELTALLGIDEDVLVPHKVPFTFGAPAVPFA